MDECPIEVLTLRVALDLALRRIVESSGDEAGAALEGVRDRAINLFKNADVPPEADLNHVKIAGPAIDVLIRIFDPRIDAARLGDRSGG
jgi:hypothetical protein